MIPRLVQVDDGLNSSRRNSAESKKARGTLRSKLLVHHVAGSYDFAQVGRTQFCRAFLVNDTVAQSRRNVQTVSNVGSRRTEIGSSVKSETPTHDVVLRQKR
jgi:hypothetical protein